MTDTAFPRFESGTEIPGLPGLALRPIRHADAPAWFDYLRLDAVTRHTSWSLGSEQDLLPQIEDYLSPRTSNSWRLAVVDTSSDRLVATVGFNEISLPHRRAEIAYDVAPAYWRRGIATRASEVLIRWGGLHLGLRRIQATVLDTNEASVSVLRHCGFEREGLLRQYRVVRGVSRDFWLFSRLLPAT